MNFLFVVLAFLGVIPAAYLLANVLLSRSYDRRRPRVSVPASAITIVIPVHDERAAVFEECVTAIAVQGCRWVVVGDASNEPYRSMTERRGGEFLYLPEHGGKKVAIAAGIGRVRTPYVLLVDSDTILPAGGATQLAAHFSDRVGGVGASLTVQDTGTSFARSAEFVERAREVVLKAMSSRGSVLYLDGACAMFRTEVIRQYVLSTEFQQPRVLGRPTSLGDDWMLTDFLLRSGYETVRAYETRVVTYPKENFSAFVRQNVRWSRSNWIRLGSYVRRGTPRAVGRFYMLEVAGTYLLPLVAVVTLAARVPLFTHELGRTSGNLGSVGFLFLDLVVPVSREAWFAITRTSLTVLGAFATGAFAGAVARDHRGPRLRFLAYGALGAGVLFVTSLYGLATFWKRPDWGPSNPRATPTRGASAPITRDDPIPRG